MFWWENRAMASRFVVGECGEFRLTFALSSKSFHRVHWTQCVNSLSLMHLNCNNRFIELCLWNQLMSRKSKSICNISKSREHRNHFGLISWIKFLLQLDLIDEIKSNIQTDWIDDYIFPTQIPTNGLKRCTKNGIARTK